MDVLSHIYFTLIYFQFLEKYSNEIMSSPSKFAQTLVYGYIRINIDKWITDSIIDIIISFHGIYNTLFDTDILSENDKYNLMEILCKQLNNIQTKLNRIYKGKPNAKKFHELCDNNGSTVTIIKNDFNTVFGGYTSISWTSPARRTETHSDPDAFLFQLHPNIKIFSLHEKDDNKAVRHNASYLIGFGSGSDLLVKHTNTGRGTFAGAASYTMKKPSDLVGGSSKSEFRVWFKVENMETFQVITS